MTLTPAQKKIALGALYTASEKYRECAKEIGKSGMAAKSRDSLVATFKKQADECSELIQEMERS